MGSTGYQSAGTATYVDRGGTRRFWKSKSNITADDGADARLAASDEGSNANLTSGRPTSHYLVATNFGFTGISDEASITGIEVKIQRRASAADSVKDELVYLTKDGTSTWGDNKADTTTLLPASVEDWYYPTHTSTEGDNAENDDWNTGGTLSGSDVNSSNFGVMIAYQRHANSKTPFVDHISMNVHYDSSIPRSVGDDTNLEDDVGFAARGHRGYFLAAYSISSGSAYFVDVDDRGHLWAQEGGKAALVHRDSNGDLVKTHTMPLGNSNFASAEQFGPSWLRVETNPNRVGLSYRRNTIALVSSSTMPNVSENISAAYWNGRVLYAVGYEDGDTIYAFNIAGELIREVTLPSEVSVGAGSGNLSGIATTHNGTVWVCRRDRNTLYKVNHNGELVTEVHPVRRENQVAISDLKDVDFNGRSMVAVSDNNDTLRWYKMSGRRAHA